MFNLYDKVLVKDINLEGTVTNIGWTYQPNGCTMKVTYGVRVEVPNYDHGSYMGTKGQTVWAEGEHLERIESGHSGQVLMSDGIKWIWVAPDTLQQQDSSEQRACDHVWKDYDSGFTQKFTFCEKCDLKAE